MQFIYRKIFSFRLPGYSLSWEHFTHMNLLCSCFCPAHYIVKSPWFQEDFTFFSRNFAIFCIIFWNAIEVRDWNKRAIRCYEKAGQEASRANGSHFLYLFFYGRTCPFPYTIFLIDVSASSPIGPLAWSFWVLMPISAP